MASSYSWDKTLAFGDRRRSTAMCERCKPVEKCEKGKDPKTCTPEQIEECHGEAPKHECKEKAKKECG
jgi:hypothetical protein